MMDVLVLHPISQALRAEGIPSHTGKTLYKQHIDNLQKTNMAI
jgi:hypothetical protein